VDPMAVDLHHFHRVGCHARVKPLAWADAVRQPWWCGGHTVASGRPDAGQGLGSD
jgi:hypothetical protein